MASPTTATRGPSALGGDAPLAPDVNGDNPQATTAGASGNGEARYPTADAAAADVSRSPSASTTQQPVRSAASLAFPSLDPAYDASPAPTPVSGALRRPPASPANTTTTTTSTTTVAATASQYSSVPALRPTLRHSTTTGPASPNFAPYRRSSSRASSVFGERASVLERRAAEARVALEMANQLKAEIDAVEEQVLRVERELEDVQRAVASGGAYRGKEGEALAAEEQRLARKERLLREEKGQLREERLMHLRSRSDQQRRGSEGDYCCTSLNFVLS